MAGKGKPKTGGRTKGVVNRRNGEIAQLAERLGVDVFKILLLIASGNSKALGHMTEDLNGEPIGEKIPLRDRMYAASELAQYIQPKLKSIEHSGTITDISGQREIERKLAMSPEARELSRKLEEALKKVP